MLYSIMPSIFIYVCSYLGFKLSRKHGLSSWFFYFEIYATWYVAKQRLVEYCLHPSFKSIWRSFDDCDLSSRKLMFKKYPNWFWFPCLLTEIGYVGYGIIRLFESYRCMFINNNNNSNVRSGTQSAGFWKFSFLRMGNLLPTTQRVAASRFIYIIQRYWLYPKVLLYMYKT